MRIPRIVRWHWNSSPKVSLNLIGPPSTVKSTFAALESARIAKEEGDKWFDWNRHAEAEKMAVTENPEGYHIFADIRALETDLGEQRLQDMMNGKDYITYKYALLFKAMSHPKAKGVLFFDEFNLAPNMLKQQFFKVVNDHSIGDIPISDGVLCMMAGNEAEQSRGVTEDPVPLVLRRGNYFIRPLNDQEFLDWFIAEGGHEYIVGYLKFKPDDVFRLEYDLPESVSQPCPRMWSFLSNLLKSNPHLSPHPEEGEAWSAVGMLAVGCIGPASARQFEAYVQSAQKVDLDALLRNPALIKQYEDNQRELSLVYAVIASVVERFRRDHKVIKPAFEMAMHLKRDSLGAFLLRSLKQVAGEDEFKKIGADDKMLPVETLRPALDRYAKFVFKSVVS